MYLTLAHKTVSLRLCIRQ